MNKQNKKIYNFLKKEFGSYLTIFEVNSKKESTTDLVQQKKAEEIKL